ncbi:hypothetical protein BDD12DRAFT_856490 [Trichophaea hybrida]|nr:hypothetical protein BDD12DRAFT_856490 [Trichophaea hybrida]
MSATLLRRLPRLGILHPGPRFYSGKKSVARRPPEDALKRRETLLNNHPELYPRLTLYREHDGRVLRHIEFHTEYGPALAKNDKRKDEVVTIRGRIRSYRDLSAKLIFYDVVQDGRKLQGISSHALIGGTKEEFYERTTALRIGDIVSITGFPGRSNTGELSLYATEHPKLLAPCLHPIPDSLQNPEKIKHHRHLDLLVHPEAAQTLKLRSRILKMIRSTLINQDFIEVQTPILSSSAGGAIAKPFLTTTSSSSRTLALRIAPELWLKRLIVGGLDRVFELGPQFRNEGIDNTHNPEFTTENLFCDVGRMVAQLKEPLGMCYALNPLDADIAEALNHSFKRLEFIPTLEAELGESLPSLEGKNAAEELKALCERHKVPVDSNTPAKMLDKLAQHFLEPMCHLPTFIMYHPACMSPLAKSGMRRGRLVSERVELFVQEQELVNAYEEENSPREQRRKFKLQMESEGREPQTSTEDTPVEEGGLEEGTDESYCSTLEWGMPPTAGWGLGVDRMVMLFSGQDRIADVLAFGGLRGAVNQGIEKPVKKEETQIAAEQSNGEDEGGKKKKKKKKEKKQKEMWERGAEVDVRELDEIFGELAESLGGKPVELKGEEVREEKGEVKRPEDSQETPAKQGMEEIAEVVEEVVMKDDEVVVKESEESQEALAEEELKEVAQVVDEMATREEDRAVQESEGIQETSAEKGTEEIPKVGDEVVVKEGEVVVKESKGNQDALAEKETEEIAKALDETTDKPKAIEEEGVPAQTAKKALTSPPASSVEKSKAKEDTSPSFVQDVALSLPRETIGAIEAGVDAVAGALGEVAETLKELAEGFRDS